jgi:acyl-CoA synthetase (AMP-forming)/AMP-acid ligase II
MLTHGNIISNVAGAQAVLKTLDLSDDEVFLSFLPLSHAYEHTGGQFLPMAVGAQIYYADGLEALASNFLEVRPTVVACVPRLYEVMRQRILRTTARQQGLKVKLFARALELGSKAYERPGEISMVERVFNRLLDRLVRDVVRARFGGRIKALISGGAPLNYDVGLFFTALGVPLFQGYGLTECSPVISVNSPGQVKLHTVGRPIPTMEVRIAADGEILARGPSVMRGYWRDEAGTRQVLRDGWLHTGDVGVIDADDHRSQEGHHRQLRRRQRGAAAGRGRDRAAAGDRAGDRVRRRPASSRGAGRPRCRIRHDLRAPAQAEARAGRARLPQGLRARSRRRRGACQRASVGDRTRASLPRHAGAVHDRARHDDPHAQAPPPADLSGS